MKKDTSSWTPGGDEDECRLDMRLLSGYLLVRDNERCGVNHVSFDGIYRRQ